MTPVTSRQTAVPDPEAAARAAYAELHAALAGHGVCVDLSALAADVTAFGEPVVRLGRTSVEGAFRLAKALRDGWTPPAAFPTAQACLAARHEPIDPMPIDPTPDESGS